MLKFSDLGLDSLSRAIKTRCISSEDVKSYCNKISENLFFISGSKKSNKELFDANIGNDFIEICNFVKQDNNIYLSVSTTSRDKRAGETAGVTYNYTTPEKFEEMIENGEMLEWA